MKILRIAAIGILLLGSILALVPMIWLILATFRANDRVFSEVFTVTKPTLANYTDLFTTVPFFQFLANSTFLACTAVCLQVFFSSLAGFALAKYDFQGKKLVMGIMLATVLIPGQLTLAPSYDLLYRMHLVDTYQGLLIPGAVSVFGIFLFRQTMVRIPDELLQAGRIDGCSEFGLYWNVVLPVSRPMIGAFSLMTFMATWNSFLWPQIMLHSKLKYTLPIALAQMVGLYQQQYGMLMAGTLVAVLPVIVLFLLLQKEFVAGLTAGAVKG